MKQGALFPAMRSQRIFDYLTRSVWAIHPEKLSVIAHIVEAHAFSFDRLDGIREAREAAEERASLRAGVERPKMVGVVPIHGLIFPRGDAITYVLGLTTTESIRGQVQAHLDDDTVGAIVFDIDSPGGLVQGVAETSEMIFNARGEKPMVAQVWDQATSAAYWLASAADEIVSTPSGEVGSIGVWMMHTEYTEKLKKEGIKTTFMRAGEFKADMNPYEPLSKEAQEHEQGQLEAIHSEFINDVARNRGVDADSVRENYGEGRVYRSKEALELGLIDSVNSFEGTVSSVMSGLKSEPVRSARSLMLRRRRQGL